MIQRGGVTDLGALLQKFFAEHLIQHKNVSPRTVESYRDTFRMLLSYAQDHLHRLPATLTLEDLGQSMVSDFLDYLETARGNCIRSRDARLAAIHTFYQYVGRQLPDKLGLAQSIIAIPFKRFEKPLLGFLSREEVKAILAAPNVSTWAGRRDQIMFSLLYNTGARVSELIGIRVEDVELAASSACVRLRGKGRKQRTIPLWRETAAQVRSWIKAQRLKGEQLLFCNRFGAGLTRASVAARFAAAVVKAGEHCPKLRGRHITCHTMRHTTAMHLLQGGIDITVISLWLGHESPATTQGYIEADIAMKVRALKTVAPPGTKQNTFKPKDRLLAFLEGL